jgi:hypothetical protein
MLLDADPGLAKVDVLLRLAPCFTEKHFKVIMNNLVHANEAKEAFRRLHLAAERFLHAPIDYLGLILHDTSCAQAVHQQKSPPGYLS